MEKLLSWGDCDADVIVMYNEYTDWSREGIEWENEILEKMKPYKGFKVEMIENKLGACHNTCKELAKKNPKKYSLETGWALADTPPPMKNYWFRHTWCVDHKNKIIYETTGIEALVYAGVWFK